MKKQWYKLIIIHIEFSEFNPQYPIGKDKRIIIRELSIIELNEFLEKNHVYDFELINEKIMT